MSEPRVVLTVEDGRGSSFRVVLDEVTDNNGVVEVMPFIERTYTTNKDRLGVQRWEQLTGKSGMSDWVSFSNALLAHVLREMEQT